MPVHYTLHPALRLKYVEIVGTTHLGELRTLSEQCFSDPQFDTSYRQLINLSGLIDTRTKFIDVFTLRNFLLRRYGSLRQPIQVSIVAPTGLGYGISKMFAMLMNGHQTMHVQIFQTVDHALASLDISKTQAQDFMPKEFTEPLLELSPEVF